MSNGPNSKDFTLAWRYDTAVTEDPTVVPVSFKKGTVVRYIPSVGVPTLFIKNDDGLSTNVTEIGAGGGSTIYDSEVNLAGPIDYGASGNNYDVNFSSGVASGSGDLSYTPGGVADSDIVTVNTAGYYKIEMSALINDAAPAPGEYVLGVTLNRPASTTNGIETATATEIAYMVTVTAGSVKTYWSGSKIVQLAVADELRFAPDSTTSVFANITSMVVSIKRVHNEQGD